MARTSSPKREKSADKILGAKRKTGEVVMGQLSVKFEILENNAVQRC
jgi:hypothetical protein